MLINSKGSKTPKEFLNLFTASQACCDTFERIRDESSMEFLLKKFLGQQCALGKGTLGSSPIILHFLRAFDPSDLSVAYLERTEDAGFRHTSMTGEFSEATSEDIQMP
ncbi:hypothetical protein M0802_016370 [Mischocyttarus mexicanus]|nr:hypothetical protein M0802_016370 [Mischocyttarus mexicanus]